MKTICKPSAKLPQSSMTSLAANNWQHLQLLQISAWQICHADIGKVFLYSIQHLQGFTAYRVALELTIN